jgi:hypothetical protein
MGSIPEKRKKDMALASKVYKNVSLSPEGMEKVSAVFVITNLLPFRTEISSKIVVSSLPSSEE